MEKMTRKERGRMLIDIQDALLREEEAQGNWGEHVLRRTWAKAQLILLQQMGKSVKGVA